MLKRNNVLPEWVELNKTIHDNIKKSRESLVENYDKLFLKPQVKETKKEKQSGFFSAITDWLFPGIVNWCRFNIF
jgi:hypothetical protein